MKETGIIMSGEHPKLILDGIKTMTRRTWGLEKINEKPDDWYISGFNTFQWYFCNKTDGEVLAIKCPYGQVGDRLWVRETHYRWGHWVKNGITKTGRQKWTFRADGKGLRYFDNPPAFIPTERSVIGWRKRPSIHMPRWASRITLEITDIRAEKLQEITYQDIIAEGMIPKKKPIRGFPILWDFLNAKRGFGWEVNPWVWVISFRRS